MVLIHIFGGVGNYLEFSRDILASGFLLRSILSLGFLTIRLADHSKATLMAELQREL